MLSRQTRTQHIVLVTVDPAKFTPEFMEEFREHFFDYDTIEEHIEHLGSLYGRGVIEGFPNEFIEGYGVAKEMGIAFKTLVEQTELLYDYEEVEIRP
ncbi:tape measure protein [Caulobacter phage CcrSC]|uniref:Tape measure protein n=1 Tax=Caulobacter phage CcrSC TaxID=2283272 RepID=A0A385EGD3_9CAUD|nr:tape measure protein [Caulobacter phage CcrSC]AXQ69957.1 tape measure protein [Caulobacter phage CcrSC]